MTDAGKLRLLADWFDAEQRSGRWDDCNGDVDVQTDLRRIACGLDMAPVDDTNDP